MFDLFASGEKKMRNNASNWLELAEKIYNYRRDQLSEADRTQLLQRIEAVRVLLREKADAAKIELGIKQLEETLRRTGGTFYPKSTLQEYVEFFLVAAIVVLGIRTYFIQPFKIPTNSMWPSYYGMTPEVYRDPATEPSAAMQAVRFVLFGAQHHKILAPASGRVGVPAYIDTYGHPHVLPQPRLIKGRKWLVFPADFKEYDLSIENHPAKVVVPVDFDFDWAFALSQGWTQDQFAEQIRKSPYPAGSEAKWVLLGKPAEEGKPLLDFDVMTGDQLLVDRFSYHFFPPKIGEGFVFRTDGITAIGREEYYVKRLVGLPGDDLEVRAPVLYRNGAPITGAKAFEKNAKQIPPYRGYANLWSLGPGMHVTVDQGGFFAMGDNSYNSSDSRFWGIVPRANVVGRPLFVYFPFTKRWGPTQ